MYAVAILAILVFLLGSATGATNKRQQLVMTIGSQCNIAQSVKADKYASSDEYVATVDAAGNIKAVGVGGAIITEQRGAEKQQTEVIIQASENVQTFSDRKVLVAFIKEQVAAFTQQVTFRIKLPLGTDDAENKKRIEAFLPQDGEYDGIFLTESQARMVFEKQGNGADVTYTLKYSDGAKVAQYFQAKKAKTKTVGLTKRQTAIKNAIEKVIKELGIKSGDPKYYKTLLVHDYLVANYKFDTDVSKAIGTDTLRNEDTRNEYYDSYEAYGLLIHKKGVCQAYAESMYLILNAVDVDCQYVLGIYGKDSKTPNHAWNRVKLDDNCWYNIDTSADDPTPDQEGRVVYKFFCITDNQLVKTHKWGGDKTNNATKYSYKNIQKLIEAKNKK